MWTQKEFSKVSGGSSTITVFPSLATKKNFSAENSIQQKNISKPLLLLDRVWSRRNHQSWMSNPLWGGGYALEIIKTFTVFKSCRMRKQQFEFGFVRLGETATNSKHWNDAAADQPTSGCLEMNGDFQSTGCHGGTALPSEREGTETLFMNSTFFIFYISKEKPSNNKCNNQRK